jgi:hypothetical protein
MTRPLRTEARREWRRRHPLLEQLPQLDESRFIVTKIHLQFDPVRVLNDCPHCRVNHAAVQVGLEFVAYFELMF